jgi:type IV pilus assembly protein PilY1
VMLVDSTSGSITFYYLSTGVGSSGTPNGIGYVAAADMDGDHITDFVYGGDLQGNMWRFDLTSTTPGNWAVTPNPVFKTPGSQPITTAPLVLTIPGSGTLPHVMVEFGTGRQVPMTNTSAATYQTAAQALYGIWDWNLSSWNALSGAQHQFATKSISLPSSPTAAVVGTSTLQAQTITSTSAATVASAGSDFRTVSSNPVCFADVSGCSQYGWFLTLASGNAFPTDPAVPQTSSSFPTSPVVYEQIIFNPALIEDAFVINTFIPPATSATSCFNATSSGWTMALNPATGGAFQTAFFLDANHNGINAPNGPATGLALGGTGTPSTLLASGGQGFLITQTGGTSSGGSGGSAGGGTGSGSGVVIGTATPGLVKGKRLTWIQKR